MVVHPAREEPVRGREEIELGGPHHVLRLERHALRRGGPTGPHARRAIHAHEAAIAAPGEARGAARPVVLHRAPEHEPARRQERHRDGLTLDRRHVLPVDAKRDELTRWGDHDREGSAAGARKAIPTTLSGLRRLPRRFRIRPGTSGARGRRCRDRFAHRCTSSPPILRGRSRASRAPSRSGARRGWPASPRTRLVPSTMSTVQIRS